MCVCVCVCGLCFLRPERVCEYLDKLHFDFTYIGDFPRVPRASLFKWTGKLQYTQSKDAVTRGNFFLQLATQRRFKLPFTREITSCNTSILLKNPTAGDTTTCICLQFYRSLKYLFHRNFLCKLQEKIASCDSALNVQFTK